MNHLPKELQRMILSFSHIPPDRYLLHTAITPARNECGWDFDAAFKSMHTTRIMHDLLKIGYFPFQLTSRAMSLHNSMLLEVPYIANLFQCVLRYKKMGVELPLQLARLVRCHRRLAKSFY